MLEKKNSTKGITLIALVITVIVLLILAAVSIATLTGNNGLLTKASQSKEETEKAQEKEGVRLALTIAQISDNGYQELNQSNLQNAIDTHFGTGKAIVTDNGDSTFTVSFIDSKRDYNITSSGVEDSIDWNEAMANAVAPESQDEERNNGVIGIGTNGNPVDMDLWEYNFDEATNGYGLNDLSSLTTTASANASSGYNSDDYDNINIPQYISVDNGKTFIPVTSLKWTFFNCTNLTIPPVLPNTVKNLDYAFRGCTNLYIAPSIPGNVQYMYATFMTCTRLESSPFIPNKVVDMGSTFSGCANLKLAPVIPKSVKKLLYTFRECSNLQGIIEINADMEDGDFDGDGYVDYRWCFYLATTAENIVLKVKGTCPILDKIISTSTSGQIYKDI